jgi:serine/threonine protein kinase/DNA-binding winged helix-turn-helix (wHTH) protein
MQPSPAIPVSASFAGFRLDLRAAELRSDDGKIVRLPDQPFRILKTLLDHPGDVVTREDLRRCLWPNDTIVEFEHSISAAMNRLRQALGDSAESPRFIETLARRGYRFMVPVQFEDSQAQQQPELLLQPLAPVAQKPELMPVPISSGQTLVGRDASHYRVLEILGGGGMGIVYKARDTRLNRPVALKFLPTEMAHDDAALERFRREAQAASALNHPNICTIYDVGELPVESGPAGAAQRFIAMEFLDGQTLERRISGKALPMSEIFDLAIEIADALSAAHAEGIIHRDIKPANVFITKRNSAKILDFGLAKLAPSDYQANPFTMPSAAMPGITLMGKAMGTPTYMSPEQVRGEELDARADLFSFGVVLYQMATGVVPFRGDTTEAITAAILKDHPELPSRLNPTIPPNLEEIILKALEKDRKFRYQSAAEIRTDFQRLKRGISSEHSVPLIAAPAVHSVQPPIKKGWPRWKKALFSVDLVTAASFAIALLLFLERPASFTSPTAQLFTGAGAAPANAVPAAPGAKAANKRGISAFATDAKKVLTNFNTELKSPALQSRTRLVDLSSAYNVTGIYTEGTSFESGLDAVGTAFPAEALGATREWEGVKFSLGPPNRPDVVTSRTIDLPSAKFDFLKMLAVAVEGDQESQTFILTYSDGSSASFAQNISDWYTPENYSGESDAAETPYRLDGSGFRDNRTFHLYGYSFALDSRKSVRSIILPANHNVLVFAIALSRSSTTR